MAPEPIEQWLPKRKKMSRYKFGGGNGGDWWKTSAWMVQECRGGYVEHFPNIWCRGVECEVRKTKFSEGDRKRKRMEEKKTANPAKGVRKKKKK